MHFITFPVASTNIFPLVNSKQGGQLATEFNLKSREMVATNSNIKYAVGPSFVHSLDDFKVTLATDSVGSVTSTSKIQVSSGRAVINGHYVETLAPMVIDMVETNINLKQNAQPALEGNLSIGIKSYFSTESTMAGAMLVENTDNMYVGIQLVITKASDFKTPNDCPDDQSAVTADLKLADFTYINGAIPSASIVPNNNATRYIASDRIYDFDSLLDEKYVSADGLQPTEFYVYSGIASNTGKPGWCHAAENLMIWDADAEHHYGYVDADKSIPTIGEAQFKQDAYGNVYLVVPHKQPDAPILNNAGKRFYYIDKAISFPTASYSAGTSGIVTKAYTDQIKAIDNQLRSYKEFTNGKQVGYWDILDTDSDGNLTHEFPTNMTDFDVGDYILVREDYTLYRENSAVPSTMYVVLPGVVTGVTYSDSTPSGICLSTTSLYAANYVTEDIPEVSVLGATMHLADYYDSSKSYTSGYNLASGNHWTVYDGKTYHCSQNTTGAWDSTCWEEVFDFDIYSLFDMGASMGISGKDYFCVEFHSSDDTTIINRNYVVNGTSAKTWSKPIVLTGGVPLATESQVGGFYNIPSDEEYADAGFVIMDETGHLRLRDYALLRTGTLAYQLGADYSVSPNQTLEYIQKELNNSVNERIAFVQGATLTDKPTVITVKIPLPSEESGIMNIYDLDSRFGTVVRLLFTGDEGADYSNIVINITNCEKVMIDSNITTFQMGPMINVFRSCLYYDPEVINYIRLCDTNNQREVLFSNYADFTGFADLTIWYSQFKSSDPDLIINGMEIMQPNATMTTQDISFWSEDIPDDSHYSYALRSITLSGSGKIIACSLYVSNSTSQTAPITTTRHIIIGGDFILPQGSDLNYPQACVDDPLKVTGTFTTAYKYDSASWVVTDTSFSAQSGTYDSSAGMENGSIAFNSETYLVESTYIPTDKPLDSWLPNSWHIFYGGAIVGGL